MHHISTIETKNKNPIAQLTTVNNNLTTIDNCSRKEVDILLKDCSDLIEPTFKEWFAKSFYSLNRNKIIQLASVARNDGKNPRRYFSYLIKSHSSCV